MIIGLTGSMGSGKGEIVRLLEGMGFNHITLSSIVREEARKQNIPEEREKLMEVGNAMRRQDGSGVLAKCALRSINGSSSQNWVVDGIRNPEEISELKKGEDVHIVGVYANRDTLVDRIMSRNRDSDAKDRAEILRKIDRELGLGEPEDGQQVAECMLNTDVTISNEGTLNELKDQFLSFYNKAREKSVLKSAIYGNGTSEHYIRPSKDEYYLDLAKSVCRRGTCTKVEIGAVIIRDDQVVATGYCGAPRGTKSSHEHGFCLRKKLNIPSGHRYEMCRSVHAEQNAIINAARSGTSLLGGDMYIFGAIQGTECMDAIDAFPCFICKKMLINCGLKRVICSLREGGFKSFNVEDWISDWKEKDIIDDRYQYGEGYKSPTI